jgi:hypothetical protein
MHGKRERAVAYYRNAGILKRVLELLELGYSQEDVATCLNNEGYVNALGEAFNQPMISRLLRRERRPA